NPCQVSLCDEASDACVTVAGNDGSPCSDESPCTAGETCAAGSCTGGLPANEGVPCDDGTLCTTNDVCTSRSCVGTISSGPAYFAEDFSDTSQGWTLGTEWAIGPAQASMTAVFGPDPASDHSPTGDNGVAGVVIGGNETPVVHDFYWLESPPFSANGN